MLPTSKPLYAEDLRVLCEIDEAQLRQEILRFPIAGPEARVAVIPDVETMQWHHAREEFVARELIGRFPDVKGAMSTMGDGKRVWCIWTRVFGSEKDGYTLYILRLVVEGEDGSQDVDEEHATATAAVLRAAQEEAATWEMQAVEIWNPSPTIVAAANKVLPGSVVVERESESITSLMWYGSEEVDWIANDKYGWC